MKRLSFFKYLLCIILTAGTICVFSQDLPSNVVDFDKIEMIRLDRFLNKLIGTYYENANEIVADRATLSIEREELVLNLLAGEKFLENLIKVPIYKLAQWNEAPVGAKDLPYEEFKAGQYFFSDRKQKSITQVLIIDNSSENLIKYSREVRVSRVQFKNKKIKIEVENNRFTRSMYINGEYTIWALDSLPEVPKSKLSTHQLGKVDNYIEEKSILKTMAIKRSRVLSKLKKKIEKQKEIEEKTEEIIQQKLSNEKAKRIIVRNALEDSYKSNISKNVILIPASKEVVSIFSEKKSTQLNFQSFRCIQFFK